MSKLKKKNKKRWFIYDDDDNKLRLEYFASEGKARAFIRTLFRANGEENWQQADLAFNYKKEIVNG